MQLLVLALLSGRMHRCGAACVVHQGNAAHLVKSALQEVQLSRLLATALYHELQGNR